MENEFITSIATQGAFAALFVWLLIDTRRDSKQREEKYIGTIDKLADKLGVVENVQKDVSDIKDFLNLEGAKKYEK